MPAPCQCWHTGEGQFLFFRHNIIDLPPPLVVKYLRQNFNRTGFTLINSQDGHPAIVCLHLSVRSCPHTTGLLNYYTAALNHDFQSAFTSFPPRCCVKINCHNCHTVTKHSKTIEKQVYYGVTGKYLIYDPSVTPPSLGLMLFALCRL